MRYLHVLSMILITLCSGAVSQTLWGVLDQMPDGCSYSTNNYSPDNYLVVNTNRTTIPCLYNDNYDESGWSNFQDTKYKYIYPQKGYEFILLYVEIKNHGYNYTPGKNGLTETAKEYNGIRFSPYFVLLVDGLGYHPQSPIGLTQSGASIGEYNDTANSGSIREFNLNIFKPNNDYGDIALADGQNASGFIIYYIPKNHSKIGLTIRGLNENCIAVRKPFGKAKIPIDYAHKLIELHRHPPSQEYAPIHS